MSSRINEDGSGTALASPLTVKNSPKDVFVNVDAGLYTPLMFGGLERPGNPTEVPGAVV